MKQDWLARFLQANVLRKPRGSEISISDTEQAVEFNRHRFISTAYCPDRPRNRFANPHSGVQPAYGMKLA
ncbi:MAG: hypothetical protein CVV13_08710 [Gammaproteobacteria bacterium HGW-Gammaproteobacteria-3]|nr:MAG: hypothetical protein CVV13_08710 [Gammaproteobacteria bacterium HGW-Gammaproteobacteria-3]